MKVILRLTVAIVAATLAAACGDLTGNARAPYVNISSVLGNGYLATPYGYTNSQTTYDSTAAPLAPFFPGLPWDGMGRRPGPSLWGDIGPMIGGGLGADFLGGSGLGSLFGRGPFGDPDVNGSTCVFDATSGRLACAPVTEHGLTIIRSIAFTDIAGAAEPAFNSGTTNSINTQVQVSGTVTRRDSATTIVTDSSNRTVSGLANGSTQHTVNGTATGLEVTSGRDSEGAFSVTRAAADTVRGVVIPLSANPFTYPTAGTIIRAMSVTLSVGTQSPGASSRREVITYNGTRTAQVVITVDGTTKTCMLPLPFGQPNCD